MIKKYTVRTESKNFASCALQQLTIRRQNGTL